VKKLYCSESCRAFHIFKRILLIDLVFIVGPVFLIETTLLLFECIVKFLKLWETLEDH